MTGSARRPGTRETPTCRSPRSQMLVLALLLLLHLSGRSAAPRRKNKMATLQPEFESTVRRRSITTIGRDGRRRTVDLTELSDADRQLAEQFGYKPVRTRRALYSPQWSHSQPLRFLRENLDTYRPSHSQSALVDCSRLWQSHSRFRSMQEDRLRRSGAG